MAGMKKRKIKDRQRCSVTLQPGGKSGRGRRWAYDYRDIARILGMTYASVRQKVFLGWEPTLENLYREWYRRRCLGTAPAMSPE